MNKKKLKLAVVSTHPIQYHTPIFRSLENSKLLKLKVFFGCKHGLVDSIDKDFLVSFKWDYDITKGFKYQFLSNLSIKHLSGVRGIILAIKSLPKILKFKPNYVLVFSYTPTFIFFLSIFLNLFNIKLILRAETSDIALSRTKTKLFIRQKILKLFYKNFVHFFPIGSKSYDHYISLSIPKKFLTKVNYSIDVEFFNNQFKKWSSKKNMIKKSLGISSNQYVFLYCGKMFKPKNPLLIPKAFGKLSNDFLKNITLIAIGDGIMRKDFEDQCKFLLNKRSIFLGFKNQSEIAKYYSISDALIIPSMSGETWGLVVNEALQFGLKVLASNKVGSSYDLINNGLNGYIFENNNSQDLANSIKLLLGKKTLKNKENYKFIPPHPSELASKLIEFIESDNKI